MTAQLTARETIAITVTETEMRESARQLFAAETQAGRMDLGQYDIDSTKQEHWFRRAQRFALDRVNQFESAGQPISYTYVAGV